MNPQHPIIAATQWMPFYGVVIYITIGWCIRLAMVPVVLRRELAPGAALAWLGIVSLHPYIGFILYMTIGETRLGPGRAQRHEQLVHQFRSPSRNTPEDDAKQMANPYQPMVLESQKISGLPIVGGNAVDFFADSVAMVDKLIADIDSATTTVHLLYYIFAPDESGKRVVAALERAAARGVKCRVLVDAVASRLFFKRQGLSAQLKEAGIETAAALPVAPLKRRLPRMDLRNHRKLAIIDANIAFVGSQNLINADYGGRAGGPWFDLTGRFTGPIVAELATVFREDWAFETGVELESLSLENLPDAGAEISAQAVPTGPSSPGHGFRRVFLAAVQCARHRIVLTTPYFVTDETTLVALMMAADQGVQVDLIVPLVADHLFTAMAGRAHYTRLLEAGVKIYQYRPGLIHAKTITIDDAFGVIGTANLDVRSFNLNFELSVVMYSAAATARLREAQMQYLKDCDAIDAEQWNKRSTFKRYAERAVSLLSPLL